MSYHSIINRMKKISYYINIYIVILFTPFVSLGQENTFKDLILGTWELTEEDNKNIEYEKVFYFQGNGDVDYKKESKQYKAKYYIQDSLLRIDFNTYKIKKLDKNELIIQEGDFVPQISKYKRSDLKINPIKWHEKFEVKLPNGVLKIEGQLYGGFRDGVWIERFENGQIESLTFYRNEGTIWKIEFESNGKTKSKFWIDLRTGEIYKE